ncbi:Crp/Fnr family transcriptional regulator [Maridesulfovibrio sp.]|uniref:Crp/Fnr family transcriptional regulator n=1 Tax=Maridesulfovibrio sp. TaxID=2795000 RepID=UPI003BAA2F6D
MKEIENGLAQELLEIYGERKSSSPEKQREMEVRPGESIIVEGQVPDAVFIILSGSMKVHLNMAKGSEYLVALEGPGKLLGEVEALTGSLAACSVTALEECRVATVLPADYETWLAEDHRFALLVNRILSFRLQSFTRRAAVNLSYPLEYSVLKMIKMQFEEHGSRVLQISKEEIANYLGTSLRSINRIFKGLQDKNILAPNKEIEIISIDEVDRLMELHENK